MSPASPDRGPGACAAARAPHTGGVVQLLVLTASLNLGACGAIAGSVTEGATESQIDTLRQPEEQYEIAQIASDPQVRKAVREMSQAVAEGVVAGIAQALSDERSALRGSLRGAFDELRPEVNSMVEQASSAAVERMFQAAARGLEHDLAPAFARAVRREFSGAVVQPLQSRELRRGVAEMTRTISKNAVVGSAQGLDAVAEREPPPSLLEGLVGTLETPLSLGWVILVTCVTGVAIAVVVMLLLVFRGRTQRRQLMADTQRREELMISMLQATLTRDMSHEQREQFLRDFHADFAAAH